MSSTSFGPLHGTGIETVPNPLGIQRAEAAFNLLGTVLPPALACCCSCRWPPWSRASAEPRAQVAIGVALLRYHLFDIDRLINRTLVYGLLTALLGGFYAIVVPVLGQLFGGIGAKPPSWGVPAPPWRWPRCSAGPAPHPSSR
jgi:hypothetical protein